MARAKETPYSISDEDRKNSGFKTAPGGKYHVRVTEKSKMVAGRGGDKQINLQGVITKGPHKGVTFFDRVAEHVTFKLVQLENAFGRPKKTTLERLLKHVVKVGESQAILRETEFEGRRQNKVVTWLPLNDESDDDEWDDEEEWEEEEEDEDDEWDEDEDEDDEEDEEEDEEDEEDEDEDWDDEDDEDEDDDDEDEDDEDEDDDEDDEEEEEEPEPKKKRSRRASAKKAAPKKKAVSKKKAPPKKKAAKKSRKKK